MQAEEEEEPSVENHEGDSRFQAKQLFLRYPQHEDLCVAAHINKLNFPGHDDELRKHLSALGLAELQPYLVWIPFERFVEFSVLGRGGFATVYRATVKAEDQRMFLRINVSEGVDMRSELQFALKELNENLVHEMVLNAHLSFHRIHSCQMDSVTKELIGLTRSPVTNRYHMIMELASSGSLETLLRDNPPQDWSTITRHALNIAKALSMIHKLGLVHNDLHPGNVVFDHISDAPFIIDIGLGHAMGRSHDDPHGCYGRFEYLPPEAFREEECTQKSDVYCFGTLMWQLVTASEPRLYGAIPQFADGLREELIPGVPTAYEDIYVACWDPDPEMRPTIEEVKLRLEGIKDEMERAPMASKTVEFVRGRREAREHDGETSRSSVGSDFTFAAGTVASRIASMSSFYSHEELKRIRSRTTMYDIRRNLGRRTAQSVLLQNGDMIYEEDRAELRQPFCVSVDDRCSTVLPWVLAKYNITDNWQDYTLWLRYDNEEGVQERALAHDERPLHLFRELKDHRQNLVFAVKRAHDDIKIQVPMEEMLRPQSQSELTGALSLDDPLYKLLVIALRKYRIKDDWRNYAMCMRYSVGGEVREREFGLEEKPLRIFADVKAAQQNPSFILKRTGTSSPVVSPSDSVSSPRGAWANSTKSPSTRMSRPGLWTSMNLDDDELAWNGAEGILPKEILNQQCISVTGYGRTRRINVHGATNAQEVMVKVLGKFSIDMEKAGEYEIYTMTGPMRGARALSDAELVAICSSPDWPEKDRLNLRRRLLPEAHLSSTRVIIGDQQYESMDEVKRRCVCVIGIGAQTRMVDVVDARDARDVMARVLGRFGIADDAAWYSILVWGGKEGEEKEARTLSDEALLEICRSIDRPEKEQFVLRKKYQCSFVAPEGSLTVAQVDDPSRSSLETTRQLTPPFPSPSSTQTTSKSSSSRPVLSKICTVQLLGEAPPPELLYARLAASLSHEDESMEEEEEEEEEEEDRGEMVAGTDDETSDIAVDLAPYFPDQRQEVLDIARILRERRRSRHLSGWSMDSEFLALADEVRSPKTLSLYVGKRGVVPVLMQMIEEIGVKDEGRGEKSGGEMAAVEGEMAAVDLDLSQEMPWLTSAII